MVSVGSVELQVRLDRAQLARDIAQIRRIGTQFRPIEIPVIYKPQSSLPGGNPIPPQIIPTQLKPPDTGPFQQFITGFFQGVGQQITAILTSAISSALSQIPASFGTFLEFERQIQTLTVVSGQSRDELEGITDEIQRLGIETSKAPAEVAALTVALARAGLAADQIGGSLEGIVRLSEATGVGLEQAGAFIGSAIASFQLAAEDSDRIADLLTTVANNSSTSADNIGSALDRAGGALSGFSQNIETSVTAIGLLANQGFREGERAATALESVVLGLQENFGKLEAQGIQVFDDQGSARDLLAIFGDISNQIGGLSDQAQQDFLSEIFSQEGIRGARALVTALEDGNAKTQNLLNALDGVEGAATRAGAAILQGVSGQLTLLEGSLETLQTNFGSIFDPLVEAFALFATETANALIKTDGLFDPFIDAGEDLLAVFQENSEFAETLAEAIGDVAQAFANEAAEGIQRFVTVLKENPELIKATIEELADAIVDLITIFGNIASAVGEISVGLASFLDLVRQGREFLDGFTGALGPFGNVIETALNPLQTISNLTQAGESFLRGFRNPFDTGNIEEAAEGFGTIANEVERFGRSQRVFEQGLPEPGDLAVEVEVETTPTAEELANNLVNTLESKTASIGIDIEKAKIDLDENQLSQQLQESASDLIQEQFQTQIDLAELEGDSVRALELREDALIAQVSAIQEQQKLAREQLEIEQELATLEADRAIANAELEVAKAQAGDATAEEIAALQNILQLERDRKAALVESQAIQDEILDNQEAIAQENINQDRIALLREEQAIQEDLNQQQLDALEEKRQIEEDIAQTRLDAVTTALDAEQEIVRQRQQELSDLEQLLALEQQRRSDIAGAITQTGEVSETAREDLSAARERLSLASGLGLVDAAEFGDLSQAITALEQAIATGGSDRQLLLAAQGADSPEAFSQLLSTIGRGDLAALAGLGDTSQIDDLREGIDGSDRLQSIESIASEIAVATDRLQGAELNSEALEAKLDQLNANIEALANTPRSLNVSTPDPVADSGRILSDLSRGKVAAAGL